MSDKYISETWIRDYVDQMINVAKQFEEESIMREATLLRADHAMDLVKAWRREKRDDPPNQLTRDLQARIVAALKVADEYGGIDGGHHKMWVIDQMVRALLGKEYVEWVHRFNASGGEWDEGTAP